ncbi:hybrid sensor histidine kinase/response regulator [Aromatoleum sp.]|uniref:hybrid sensor histidine kinase/response regulator n=1 Tax=Aromatoleum sp. TaxID=2307007 RepID=UPI002FCB1B5A
MPPLDSDAFLNHLRATFRLEADEHLRAISALLRELEQPVSGERGRQAVETLFREAHSLKGAARAVNLADVEAVCADLETRLAKLKREEASPTPAFVEALALRTDELARLVAADAAVPVAPASQAGFVAAGLALRSPPASPTDTEGTTPGDLERSADTPAATQPAVKGGVADAERPTAGRAPRDAAWSAGETVRIPAARLAAVLVQAEELLAFKVGAGQLAAELRAVSAELTAWRKAWSRTAREVRALRRASDRNANGTKADGEARSHQIGTVPGQRMPTIDAVLDAVERDEHYVKALCDRLNGLQRVAEREQRTLGGLADAMQDDVKQMLLQPFGVVFELLPRLARDLARDSGKEAELRIDGEAIEIDRRILEQLKDPLIHLVRNAVDHGIEAPAERVRRGKGARGRIHVAVVSKEGNRVELRITDDGAGIDARKVAAAAVALGLVTPAEADALPDAAACALVYASGLSTSPVLTGISGRGLGLAIVREKIEKLGGSIAIESPAEGGTAFRIVLPTSLANFRGLLVGVGDSRFVIPTRDVERVARIGASSVRTAGNRDAIELGGEALSLVRLADVLGVPSAPASRDARHLCVAVLASEGRRIALAVDAVLGDQEVLVKGLGPQLRRVRNVAGATVLGAGRVVPILSVPDLMKSALADAALAPPPDTATKGAGASRTSGSAEAGSGASASTLRTAALAAPDDKQARLSLLVVEDSVTSRTLLKNILESSGYDVATAVDGVDALTALHTGRFDLVVSDVEMPRMDGFALTQWIRQDRKLADLPVVLVTALASREHRERGVEAGANAYVVKSSFDQSDLLAVIRRLT